LAVLRFLRRCAFVAWDAYWRFTTNDGWAIASHLALAILLALFPFLIFVTALAGFLGTRELATQVVDLLLSAWPEIVVRPIESEVYNVLTGQRRDLLTLGAVLMLWFSSSGIEAVRVGLNRAYGFVETRWWYTNRAQSMFFVVLGAFALLSLAFLVVLAPPAFQAATAMFPAYAREIAEVQDQVFTQRYAATAIILGTALFGAHLLLPNGRLTLAQVLPGILVTMIAWIAAATIFAWYLTTFASYATTYAGFAAVMIALVFLYFIAVIFILGGELNSAWQRSRTAKTPPPDRTLLPIDG
jgi:membrane protein